MSRDCSSSTEALGEVVSPTQRDSFEHSSVWSKVLQSSVQLLEGEVFLFLKFSFSSNRAWFLLRALSSSESVCFCSDTRSLKRDFIKLGFFLGWCLILAAGAIGCLFFEYTFDDEAPISSAVEKSILGRMEDEVSFRDFVDLVNQDGGLLRYFSQHFNIEALIKDDTNEMSKTIQEEIDHRRTLKAQLNHLIETKQRHVDALKTKNSHQSANNKILPPVAYYQQNTKQLLGFFYPDASELGQACVSYFKPQQMIQCKFEDGKMILIDSCNLQKNTLRRIPMLHERITKSKTLSECWLFN